MFRILLAAFAPGPGGRVDGGRGLRRRRFVDPAGRRLPARPPCEISWGSRRGSTRSATPPATGSTPPAAPTYRCHGRVIKADLPVPTGVSLNVSATRRPPVHPRSSSTISNVPLLRFPLFAPTQNSSPVGVMFCVQFANMLASNGASRQIKEISTIPLIGRIERSLVHDLHATRIILIGGIQDLQASNNPGSLPERPKLRSSTRGRLRYNNPTALSHRQIQT